MENNNSGGKIFLVLVPHRDVRVEARKYTDFLLKAGLKGVYQFPLAAPLAQLSRQLTIDELKNIARTLRKITEGGKIYTAGTSATAFPAGGELFGPRLDLEIPLYAFCNDSVKIASFLSPIIFGSFLIPENNKQVIAGSLLNNIPPLPQLAFRAAAVANMFWQPFGTDEDIGYNWKIGKLCWLPSQRRLLGIVS